MSICVVCLDGTNQFKFQTYPTNIARMFDAIGGNAADAGQGSFESDTAMAFAKYLPGVGSAGSQTLRVLGNLFGDGIAELIIRGYTYVSRTFHSGDSIILTGFSRGATAARALGGLIAARGVMDASRYDDTDKETAYKRAVAAWYAYRGNAPNLADQARLRLFETLDGGLPQLGDEDFTGPLDIAAIGVFDTVSSLGLPVLGWNGVPKFDFSICNTTLSPEVAFGFHALAGDETRDLFTPTFWEERNGIIQQIFAGCHSNVGGGLPETGLSDCALSWMLGQLNQVPGCNSLFDVGRIDAFNPSPLETDRDEARVFPFSATPHRARSFPKIAIPSDAMKARFGHFCGTQPGTTMAPYTPTGRYADGSALLT